LPTNESGLNPYGVSPYTDTGTGAYEGPPAEVTYGTEHDPNPTGAHPGPPLEVTVESPPEHLSEPTGAHDGPSASVTYTQHPAEPEQPKATKAKAVKADEVEDKAVHAERTSTKKRGS